MHRFLAQFAEGIDAAYLSGPLQALERSLFGHAPLVVLIAGVACAALLMQGVRGALTRIGGASDLRNALSHAGARLSAFAGVGARHAWGAVYDHATGKPLAYARVTLTDRYHHEVASSVCDRNGVYGFATPLSHALTESFAASIVCTKDGYHASRASFALHAGVLPDTLDIGLERRS
jgi:hypothetical protein